MKMIIIIIVMKILRKVLAKKALGCEVFNQDRRVTLNL